MDMEKYHFLVLKIRAKDGYFSIGKKFNCFISAKIIPFTHFLLLLMLLWLYISVIASDFLAHYPSPNRGFW